jgi:metal-responsive CopG/Arc/MetJ family transcriptional regulator
MKGKTSVTLSRDVLAGIDRLAGSKYSRSAVIDNVLRQYLKDRAKAAIQRRDLELINASLDELNAEAEDVLDYQVPEE